MGRYYLKIQQTKCGSSLKVDPDRFQIVPIISFVYLPPFFIDLI